MVLRRPTDRVPPQSPPPPRLRWLSIAAGTGALLAIAGFGLWQRNASALPAVEVVAADPSARSRAAANGLFIKLGSLAEVGEGKWQLLDSSGATRKPDLLFRTSETGLSSATSANLLLLDGKNDSLLWSREFNLPAGRVADLRQQVALTAGRVLGCALESREKVHLSADLLKTFLDAWASLADLSGEDYGPVTTQLRRIVERAPEFEPAWSRLIMSEVTAIEFSRFTPAFLPLSRQLNSMPPKLAEISQTFPNWPWPTSSCVTPWITAATSSSSALRSSVHRPTHSSTPA